MILTKQVKKTTDKTPDLIINNKNYKGVNVLSWKEHITPYYELSPYYLKTDNGYIFENYWQGLKVYSKVSKQEIYTHYTKKGNKDFLLWEHGEEQHLNEKEEILPAYFEWRKKLWNCKNAIRYPNGFHGRHQCKFALVENERLGYIECRKKIYFKEYIRLIRKLDIYKKLLSEVKNIIIYEVDVPEKNKKGKFNEVLDGGFYYCTLKKLDELLNSSEEAFGHGLCLAYALLEDIN